MSMDMNMNFNKEILEKLSVVNKTASSLIVIKFNDDDTKLEVEKEEIGNCNFQGALDALPDNEGRFVVVHERVTLKDNRQPSAIFAINWLPHTLPIKKRIPFSVYKKTLFNNLKGNIVDFVLDYRKELVTEVLIEKAVKQIH